MVSQVEVRKNSFFAQITKFLRQFSSLALTLYLIITINLGFLVTFLIQVILFLLLWPLNYNNENVRYYVLGRVFRFVAAFSAVTINPWWHVKIHKKPKSLKSNGRVIYMFNHCTQADPWICSYVMNPIEAKWIYKQELLKLPIINHILRFSGDIAVDTKTKNRKPEEHVFMIQNLMDRVKYVGEIRNFPIVVFPEGTRSKTGALQPFKNGFFRFAVENGWSIIPCVIHKTSDLWPLGTLLVAPGVVYASIGDEIFVKQGETPEELKYRVRNKMIEMIIEMPNYNPITDLPLPHDAEFSERSNGFLGKKKSK